jgi:hypothetical protein
VKIPNKIISFIFAIVTCLIFTASKAESPFKQFDIQLAKDSEQGLQSKKVVVKNISSSQQDTFVELDYLAEKVNVCAQNTHQPVCISSTNCPLGPNEALSLNQGQSCFITLKASDVSSVDEPGKSLKGNLEVRIKYKHEPTSPAVYSSLMQFKRDIDLYIAGNFDQAGGVPGTSHIARFDGHEFHALGNGIIAGHTWGTLGQANALEMFQGDLIVGGDFNVVGDNVVASNIASWNGYEWRPLSRGGDSKNNGTSVPVNALKGWQLDPKKKNSEALIVGLDWGNGLLSVWKDNIWYGVSGGDFTTNGKECQYSLEPYKKWRIRSLAVLGDNTFMTGGLFCIHNSWNPNKSVGLRAVSNNFAWFTGSIENDLSGFSNSPTGDNIAESSLSGRAYAPDVYALYPLKIGSQESLLVGGMGLMDHNSDAYQDSTVFMYSEPGTKNFTQPSQEWASNKVSIVRAFATGSKPGEFYMAGRGLDKNTYIVKGNVLMAGAEGKIKWEQVNNLEDWVYNPYPKDPDPRDQTRSDIILSLVRAGDKVYVAGRFRNFGNYTQGLHANSIGVLVNNDEYIQLLGPKMDQQGVTMADFNEVATVNAMLVAPSLTISLENLPDQRS